jgi:hypothetical protein
MNIGMENVVNKIGHGKTGSKKQPIARKTLTNLRNKYCSAKLSRLSFFGRTFRTACLN